MTTTCATCNNNLGVAEAELTRFIELNTTAVLAGAEGGELKGLREATVAIRHTTGNVIGLFPTSAHREYNDLLAQPGTTLHSVRGWDMNLVTIAIIKQLYLAACLLAGGVPDSPTLRLAQRTLQDFVNSTETLAHSTPTAPIKLEFAWTEGEMPCKLMLANHQDGDNPTRSVSPDGSLSNGLSTTLIQSTSY